MIWNVLNKISFFMQNVSLSTCYTNFVAALAQKLMDENAWNFVFSYIYAYTYADYILVHITREVTLLFEIFDYFKATLLDKTACNCTNADYSDPIILKFKAFVCYSNNKVTYFFKMWGQYSSPHEWSIPLGGGGIF